MERSYEDEYKSIEKLKLKDVDLDAGELHKIICPSCSGAVPAENININSNVAKCNHCHGVFSFDKQIKSVMNPVKNDEDIVRPEGVEINRYLNELELSIAQPIRAIEVIIASIIPFLVFAISIIIANVMQPKWQAAASIFIVCLATIIGYIYYSIDRKKHRSFIHLDKDYLYVENRPKKFIKDKRFPIRNIDQVYTKKTFASSGETGTAVYIIFNGDDGQSHDKLIFTPSKNSSSQAKYIEQEIERYLGIADRRIPEENG